MNLGENRMECRFSVDSVPAIPIFRISKPFFDS